MRDTWRALALSRLLVWAVGCLAVLLLGTAQGAVHAFDQTGISTSFGSIGNVLAAPAVRWDSIWYLQIAHSGYTATRETAFYPLYPLLIHVGAWLTLSPVAAGIVISLVASFVGLELVRRLAEVEFGRRAARATVMLVAFGPMALFLSAVYTEPLFLPLSAGTIYSARRGQWALTGVLGGLAALTRVSGLALIVPVLLMYFYGPRSDLEPRATRRRLAPRYAFTPSALWVALIPLGTLAFAAFLALQGFGAASDLHVQQAFSKHELVLPFVGMWDGVLAAVHQLRLEFAGVDPLVHQTQGLLQAIALVVALAGCLAVARRMPPAYAAYVAVGLLFPLSTPTVGDPLRGLARYASVLFPLYMVLGAWAAERRIVRTLLLASVVLLALFTVQFSTWHVVGGLLI